jgi:hypothetical protein
MSIGYLLRKKVPVIAIGIAGLTTLLTGCSNPYDLPFREGNIVKVNAPFLGFNAQYPNAPCGGGYCNQWVDLTQDSLCEVIGVEEFERNSLIWEGSGIDLTYRFGKETAFDVTLHCDELGDKGESNYGVGHLAVTRAELDSNGNPVIYLASASEANTFNKRNSWLHRTFPRLFKK